MKEEGVSESGFVVNSESEFDIKTGMTDVKILHVTDINVLACGRRYGRLWLLKGLLPELRQSAVDRRRLQKEFEIHSRLLHPGVVQASGFEEIEGLGLCIVEEWVEGKTLSELLKEGKLSKKERRRIMREIISTVGYMHSRGVVHRDLKPSNIMVRNAGGGVVLIDFGLADTDDYAELKQGAGSPGYISPEQARDGGAVQSDDIYSLGVIMTELCPEYKDVANSCKGPVKKRPKDAAALIRKLDRHDRLPKIILTVSAIAVITLLAVIAGAYIHSINKGAREAQENVVALSETNKRQERLVSELTDSLTGVTGRMKSAEDQIREWDEYQESRKQAYLSACGKIDALYNDFEKRVMPMFEKAQPAFYDSIHALHKKMQYICDTAFDLKRFPELKDEDAFKLNEDVAAHYRNKFSEYYTIWLAKLYANEVRENNGRPDVWPPKHVLEKVEAEKLANDSSIIKAEETSTKGGIEKTTGEEK